MSVEPGPGRPPDLDSGGQQAEPGLARRLSESARSWQAEPDLDRTLGGIVIAAVDNVAGAEFAGITLFTKGGRLSTPAALPMSWWGSSIGCSTGSGRAPA